MEVYIVTITDTTSSGPNYKCDSSLAFINLLNKHPQVILATEKAVARFLKDYFESKKSLYGSSSAINKAIVYMFEQGQVDLAMELIATNIYNPISIKKIKIDGHVLA